HKKQRARDSPTPCVRAPTISRNAGHDIPDGIFLSLEAEVDLFEGIVSDAEPSKLTLPGPISVNMRSSMPLIGSFESTMAIRKPEREEAGGASSKSTSPSAVTAVTFERKKLVPAPTVTRSNCLSVRVSPPSRG